MDALHVLAGVAGGELLHQVDVQFGHALFVVEGGVGATLQGEQHLLAAARAAVGAADSQTDGICLAQDAIAQGLEHPFQGRGILIVAAVAQNGQNALIDQNEDRNGRAQLDFGHVWGGDGLAVLQQLEICLLYTSFRSQWVKPAR